MIKVFEDFSYSRVGQLQSLLESEGIRTFLKNEFGSSVVGELPFVEVIPQLFVLETKDVEKARRLLSEEQANSPEASAEQPKDWVCSNCGSEVEGNFSCCWNCSNPSAVSTS